MTITLYPVPPYDFLLSTGIYKRGDPAIRKSEEGRFWLVIRLGDTLALAEISPSGSREEPELTITFRSNARLGSQEEAEGARIISGILNLDDNLMSFYESVKGDPQMGSLIKRLYGLNILTTPTLFEALIGSIIEQQISLDVARALESRLIRRFGDPIPLGDRTYYAFPTEGTLSAVAPEQFRECGLSVRKGEYIRDAAAQFADGWIKPGHLKDLAESEAIIDELCRLRGVGRWTAELTILRGLHKLDTVPADDLGLKRAISARYCGGRKINGEEARKVADRWGEYRGLACFYLLVADQMKL